MSTASLCVMVAVLLGLVTYQTLLACEVIPEPRDQFSASVLVLFAYFAAYGLTLWLG